MGSHRRESRRFIQSQLDKGELWDGKDVPEALRCPISDKLMEEPVVHLATGFTYDRSSITPLLPGLIEKAVKEYRSKNSSSNHAAAANMHFDRRGEDEVRRLAGTIRPNWVIQKIIGDWCNVVGVEAPKACSHIPPPAYATTKTVVDDDVYRPKSIPHRKQLATTSSMQSSVPPSTSSSSQALSSTSAPVTKPQAPIVSVKNEPIVEDNVVDTESDTSSSDDDEDFAVDDETKTKKTSSNTDEQEKNWAIRGTIDTDEDTDEETEEAANDVEEEEFDLDSPVKNEKAKKGRRNKGRPISGASLDLSSSSSSSSSSVSLPQSRRQNNSRSIALAVPEGSRRLKRKPKGSSSLVTTISLSHSELAQYYEVDEDEVLVHTLDGVVEKKKKEKKKKRVMSGSSDDQEQKDTMKGASKGKRVKREDSGSSKEEVGGKSKKKGNDDTTKKKKGGDIYLVDYIKDVRESKDANGIMKKEYLVKWEGYEDPKDETWEPVRKKERKKRKKQYLCYKYMYIYIYISQRGFYDETYHFCYINSLHQCICIIYIYIYLYVNQQKK
jgi:hypothetical protein